MNSSMLITYDTTVVTGLEKLACKEIQEKISNCFELNIMCGHVIFKTTSRFDQMSKLRSVDNIYVVIYKGTQLGLINGDLKKLESIFTSIMNECDWKTGIDIWKETTKFNVSDINSILDAQDTSGTPLFRVSCNRSGNHQFTSQEASSLFGGLINDIFHWKVSLKKFDLEILLTIKNDLLRVSLCLTKESLYKRHIVSYGLTTLRGTIAYNLIQIADIQPGEIICDPLCGTGVIPVECSINWRHTFVIAGDIHEVAIQKSKENLKANTLSKTDLLHWNTTKLPLKDNTVDVFITDLPFGKRIGSKRNNKKLYPLFVLEIIRCCHTGSGRIVLLTQDKHNANKTIHSAIVEKYCKFEKAFYVNMGGLDSSIYLLKRNNQKLSEINDFI